jgi:peptide/nickel transport system substrate-binding protein
MSLVLISGCGTTNTPSGTQPEHPAQPGLPEKSEQVLKKRDVSDPQSFDPVHSIGYTDPAAALCLYNCLLRLNPDTLELEGDLAVEWDVNDDATVYTFKLHEGVQWHGGYGEFTADDVKFHFERILDPDEGSRLRQYIVDVIDTIEVINDYEVRFNLKKSFSPFPFLVSGNGMLTGFITSRAAYEDLGEKYKQQPIGTGPFVLESYEPRVQWVMKANENYFRGAPKLDRYISIPIAEDSSARAALLRGEIQQDWIRIPEELKLYREVADKYNLNIVKRDMMHTAIYFMNTNIEPLNDVRVRRAILHAINREEIIEVAYGGEMAELANSVIPPGTPGYIPAFEIYDYNPEKAKALLAEAGYPSGFSTETTFFGASDQRAIFTLMQSHLKAVGIDLELNPVERAAWNTANHSGENPIGYWPASRPPDPHFIFYDYFHSDSFPPGANCAFYDGVDDLIDKASQLLDWSEREKLYHEIQRKIAEDVPFFPLSHEKVLYAFDGRVEGLKIIDLQPQFIDYSEAYLK